jgi:putative SOS response-associated peptidase YedK
MCNLYNMTSNQKAILDLARALVDKTGNMPSLPGIYPDYPAPIVRQGADGVRELVMARWGMPTPPQFLKTATGKPKKTDPGVTNIRNVKSPHWRRWLGPEQRCLVPFTAFSEPPPGAKGPDTWTWFALDPSMPLAFFAGIWTSWTSVRKMKEGEVTADLFGFLTTTPNAEVAPVHQKAMPVILTDPADCDAWLTAPADEALKLQRPLPDGSLVIVPRPAA